MQWMSLSHIWGDYKLLVEIYENRHNGPKITSSHTFLNLEFFFIGDTFNWQTNKDDNDCLHKIVTIVFYSDFSMFAASHCIVMSLKHNCLVSLCSSVIQNKILVCVLVHFSYHPVISSRQEQSARTMAMFSAHLVGLMCSVSNILTNSHQH